MMHKLSTVDRELDFHSQILSDVSQEIEFQYLTDFVLGVDKIPKIESDFPGVYFFEVLNPNDDKNVITFLEDFKTKWEIPDYKRRFVPNTKKKRMASHSGEIDWVPLYIGKSRLISKRINEHLYLPFDRNTFAMKLNSRSNLTGYRIRIRTVKIEVNNYDMIVPKIETCLRNRFNPILGK